MVVSVLLYTFVCYWGGLKDIPHVDKLVVRKAGSVVVTDLENIGG